MNELNNNENVNNASVTTMPSFGQKNMVFMVIAVIALVAIVGMATYAYFATGNLSITNVANLNATSERNNMVFMTRGGNMSLNVTAANMAQAISGTGVVAANNTTTLYVDFTANTTYAMVCTYDIQYEWTSTDRYTAHSSGVTANEFTIQATMTTGTNLNQGTNSISSEKDLATAVGTTNPKTVVTGAKIGSTGTTKTTATWTLKTTFYNVGSDQSALSGKQYDAKFKVTNVSCVSGSV